MTPEKGVSTRTSMPRVIIASGSISEMRWKNWLGGTTRSVNSALVMIAKMNPRETKHKEHTVPILKAK